MPLNETGLGLGDVRDGLKVIKVINAAVGQYHWDSAIDSGTVFTVATALAAGTPGAVTAPPAGAQDHALHGGGWREVLPDFVGGYDYSDKAIVADGGVIYRRLSAGLSGGTFAADAANWEALGSAGSDRVHLTDTATAPALAGAPTLAEITAAAGATRNTVLYYTGDDLPATAPSHVYHIDTSGTVTLLRDPSVAVDLNMTVSGQAGNDAGGAPLAPPVAPDTGDVHLELYDDFLVWWAWGGAAWVASAQIASTIPDSIFTADLTADAAHTHTLGSFGQTWNNLGAWAIDQEIAALPGNYQTTTLDTGGLAVNAIGAAGVQSDLDVAPNTARLSGAAGTEAGGVEFTQSPTPRTRAYYQSTSGGGSNAEVIVDADGIDLTFGGTEDLRVNNQPGTTGQALLSQGPDAPPIWGAAAAAPYRQTSLAAAWTLNGVNREITITQATHALPIAGSYLIQTFDATTPAAQVVYSPDSIAVNSTTGDITISVADGTEVDTAIVVLG